MPPRQEILSGSKPASRKLVRPPPIVYQEYPKTLEHPKGHGNHLCPVIVYDRSQEEEYAAKGYEPPGKADPFGFLASKATEKTDDAIRLMNERQATATEAMRKDVFQSVREAIAETVADVNDVLDDLRQDKYATNLLIQDLVEKVNAWAGEVERLKQERARPWWKFWR